MVGAGLVRNTALLLSGLGLLATSAGVVIQLRRQAGRAVPWWWWLGNGFFLALGAAGNRGLMQAALLVGGAASFGVGMAILVPEYKAGNVRFRKRVWLDNLALADQEAGGGLIYVGYIWLEDLRTLGLSDPYFQFYVTFANCSIYPALLDLDVRGHLLLEGTGEIGRPPEFTTVVQGHTTRGISPPYGGEVWLDHAEGVKVTLKQFVGPKVKDAFLEARGRTMWFGFNRLDIGVRFNIPDREGKNPQLGKRHRVTLYEPRLDIPQFEIEG